MRVPETGRVAPESRIAPARGVAPATEWHRPTGWHRRPAGDRAGADAHATRAGWPGAVFVQPGLLTGGLGR